MEDRTRTKPLAVGMSVLASLITLTVVAATITGLAATPAQAQYTNPYTGRTFNNGTSSLMDTAILGASRSLMLGGSGSSRTAITKKIRAGQAVIKAGKATTRYTPHNTFPLAFWLKRVNVTDPAKRKQWADELAIQQPLWEEEAKMRGANLGEMGDALALTFVLAWEAQTGGERATKAQFKGVADGFRKMLLRDPLYQGMTLAERQTYIEGELLNSSNAVRLLREAKRTGSAATLAEAKAGGRRVTDAWLKPGQTHFIPNPSGFTGVK